MKLNRTYSRPRLWFALLLAGFALQTETSIAAQEYAPIDSITVHGVTFVGEMASTSYGLMDSVRARLVVVNPTTEIINWPATLVFGAIHFFERWCSASFDSCTSSPSEPGDWGDEPFGIHISPGRTVLQTRIHSSYYPGGDWYQAYGAVRFDNPWDYPFPFTFYLRYTRQSIPVSKLPWTLMKARYR
jgi:hypothetical protein